MSAVTSPGRVDVDGLREKLDLVDVIGRYVPLKKDGSEWKGRCPFHDERTPSFYVIPDKGFVHCFGCGAHHDAIGFLQRYEGIEFREACERLGADVFLPDTGRMPERAPAQPVEGGKWVPLLPVPADAPDLLRADGWTVPLWNAKRAKFSRFKPTRADAYHGLDGRLLGYVLRCEFDDGKITPAVTWCIGPDGAMQWCIRPFPRPAPLCGLHDLALKPAAPVLLVEGEKCRAAGAGALPMYAVLAWPGGSKAIPYVDWTPLADRDVVLWPDADRPGREAMLGHVNYAGLQKPGVAQLLHGVGVRSMRCIDTAGQPEGWDIADAIADGWTPRQIATWAAHRVADLTMVRG